MGLSWQSSTSASIDAAESKQPRRATASALCVPVLPRMPSGRVSPSPSLGVTMEQNENSQSLEAIEQALLGAAILSPQHYQKICAELHVTDFCGGRARAVMGAIHDEIDDNGTVERLALATRLEQNKQLKNAVDVVDGLIAKASTDQTIDGHLRLVLAQSVARGKAALAKKLIRSPDDSGSITAQIDALDARLFNKKESSDINSIIERVVANIQDLHDAKVRITGIATRWPQVNEITKGLQKKKLIVVAGRPAMGKSLFAQNMAEECAIAGKPVLIFSFEMGKDEYGERMLASQSDLEMDKIICPADMTQDDFSKLSQGMGKLNDIPLYIEDSGVFRNVSAIRHRAEQIKRKHGELGMIVVDYLQLMVSNGGENRNQEITEISGNLKQLAMDLDVPVVALSQLSRKVEERADKRPMMSDLRESGAIEQDADVIIFLYRDEYYTKEQSQFKGLAEVIFEKVRRGKSGTSVMLAFRGSHQRFENLAMDPYLDRGHSQAPKAQAPKQQPKWEYRNGKAPASIDSPSAKPAATADADWTFE